MTNGKKNHETVDAAIAQHIKSEIGDNLMVVGWVVSVATKEIGNENFDANGFAHFTSESFPEYSQLGLLQTVLDDKRNSEIVAGIGGTIINAIMRMNNDGDE
jgi:hypothetical protein